MMGIQEPDNSKIFYTNINIAERIRQDHPSRSRQRTTKK